MGSFELNKECHWRRGKAGKIEASLNEKLNNVQWGRYRLGDLFDIEKTSGFNTDRLVSGTDYDYVTRTSINQGVLQKTGFVNAENINQSETWSLGLLQMDFFYRERPWYAGQFFRKIIPKFKLNRGNIIFFSSILNTQKELLLSVLVRDVDKTFENIIIELPTNNNDINFDFMEDLIADLEAQRIAELETYLEATGLKEYELTNEEEKALSDFENVEWHEFKMDDLFRRLKTKKLPYKAKELPREPIEKYILPCLTSSFMNQGLNYYAPKDDATILKNVISIPSNSDVYRAYFQSQEFTVLSDAYAIEWKYKDTELSNNQYLFTVQSINKVTDLPIYSHKNKLGGWNVVKNKLISLPVIDHQIDYDFMEKLISGLKKMAIKDLVIYKNQKQGIL